MRSLVDTLDCVFVVIFARCRRKLGVQETEEAWRRAHYQMAGILLFPIAAVALIAGSLVFVAVDRGTFLEHKRLLQIGTIALSFGVSALLSRRFRQYLNAPPQLGREESEAEWRLMVGFRAISIGIFVVVGVVAVLLHEAGLKLL